MGRAPCEDAVVVARNLSAGDVLRLGGHVRAFVLEEGSEIAPAVIMASSMGIPMVVQMKRITDLPNQSDRILVDGYAGAVALWPGLKAVPVAQECTRPRRKVQPSGDGRSADKMDRGMARRGNAGIMAWLEDTLGSASDQPLRAMVDYGLSDREIVRYCGLDEAMVRYLRGIQEIASPRNVSTSLSRAGVRRDEGRGCRRSAYPGSARKHRSRGGRCRGPPPAPVPVASTPEHGDHRRCRPAQDGRACR